MSLGIRLKRERERRGWSQMYVAEKLGITNSVLSNYERDYRDPDTKMLTKIAELYEVSADYLLGMSIARTPEQGMAFSGGGKDWTEEEIRMAEAIAAAAIENMRKQQGK